MRSAYDLYTFPHKQRQREARAQALAEIEKERKRRAHVAAMKLPDQSESDMEERFYYLSRLGGTGKRIYSETPGHWARIDHHVIHFVGGKPWLGGEPGYEALEAIWFKHFNAP